MIEDRFARQRLIPAWNQDLISSATVVVVGVGALGNEVAKNLALMGVGRLILCDPDVVSLSNLSRTVLFRPSDIGRHKVDVAAEALAGMAPDVVVERVPADLTSGVGLGRLADADVVMGCLDARRSRLELLGRCALSGARLIDGGTHPWGGEVRVRVDPQEPCHGCSYTAAERAERDVPVGCDPRAGVAVAPASIVSTALVASWMTIAAAQLLLGHDVPWRMLSLDAGAGRAEWVVVRRDSSCPHHRPVPDAIVSDISHKATVAELMSILPADAEPLSWTLFSVPGICYHCEGRYAFGHAYPHQTAPCPHCGERLRISFTEAIAAADRTTRLQDLGIAAEEIIAVRLAGGEFLWLRLK
ncbi:ThiF family adenylyltransferase [Catellatospora coxensis]|uniref:THIF-type NAD/FAD binding fold domain-containing protein n=1 Tax=Catellatospora coxensis TaxID=310354 RepID=A0A8J3L358_9ACTN|nr:ThiF family adenylyltransferase [Catellatospora coxensis]GIG10933.1 hypothetical protein Cco03nite_76330 [Catellatospora coxensis]